MKDIHEVLRRKQARYAQLAKQIEMLQQAAEKLREVAPLLTETDDDDSAILAEVDDDIVQPSAMAAKAASTSSNNQAAPAKPVRAPTALLKRERRSAFRVPVQVPVEVRVQNGANMEGILLDLSEDGMDVLTAQPLYPSAPISAHFVLPNTETEVEPRGEVAWANPNGQSGVRFVDLPEKLRASLKTWVTANSPQLPPEDPEPVSDCKLTDLSLGGCYVETDSPFPERAGIVLCLKAGDIEVKVDGTLRVMHP